MSDVPLSNSLIQFLSGETVHHTEEIKEDIILADYTDDGRLIGIEVLSPVKLSELSKLVKGTDLRESFRKFIEKVAPADLVTA